jgi:hypothetical protein
MWKEKSEMRGAIIDHCDARKIKKQYTTLPILSDGKLEATKMESLPKMWWWESIPRDPMVSLM